MTPRRRYFNITGPCFPAMHYMLPPARRLVGRARTDLIQSRAVHIDNLAERLKQPRVRQVLEPILTGDPNIIFETNDLQYCMALGLVT